MALRQREVEEERRGAAFFDEAAASRSASSTSPPGPPICKMSPIIPKVSAMGMTRLNRRCTTDGLVTVLARVFQARALYVTFERLPIDEIEKDVR